MRIALRAQVVSVVKAPCVFQSCRALLLAGKRFYGDSKPSLDQANPFQGYYADMLDAPLHAVQPATRTSPAPPPPEELPKTEEEERLAKARVVFGSRLAGPVERQRELHKLSRNIAGILVPPRPEEPDNCCMSGCVNCVWDLYRDELEDWAAKSAEARHKLTEQRAKERPTDGIVGEEAGMPSHVAASMDEDGGGSEASWLGVDSGEHGDAPDLFANIPVGIREFMKTEKKLKALKQERTTGPG